MKRLGFGCMRLPLNDPDNSGDINYELTCKMFDYFLDKGYSYFDTAYVYHKQKGELAVRECLVKRHPRESFTITTKLPMMIINTKEDIERIFAEQLSNLGVDYIDYYWLHALNRDSIKKAEELDAFNFILQKKAEGKVKHVGFSFHDSADVLDETLSKHPEMEYVQLQINYLDFDSVTVEGRKNYEVCQKHHKPVIVMEPVKGGKLAKVPDEAADIFKEANPDISTAAWALKFVADLDDVMVILSGMSDFEQVEDNVSTFEQMKKLSDNEKEVIAKCTDIIKKANRIPCTGCRYCCDTCPMNIAIPEYFDIANSTRPGKRVYNALLAQGKGKASDCIKCGVCESMCPQHLPIREYLEDIVVKEIEEA